MKIETVMADILINAHKVGETNANSLNDKTKRKHYLEGYKAALLQVSLDLGLAFGRMKKEIKEMEVY